MSITCHEFKNNFPSPKIYCFLSYAMLKIQLFRLERLLNRFYIYIYMCVCVEFHVHAAIIFYIEIVDKRIHIGSQSKKLKVIMGLFSKGIKIFSFSLYLF
jgi:hypothetical protein